MTQPVGFLVMVLVYEIELIRIVGILSRSSLNTANHGYSKSEVKWMSENGSARAAVTN